MTKTPLDSYKKLANKIFKKELGSFVRGIEVREDVDTSDDDALFFELYLDENAPRDLGRNFLFAHLYLRQKLEELDEYRFPYLNTRRPDVLNRVAETILKPPMGRGSQSVRRVAR
jgi:hypothetical protein